MVDAAYVDAVALLTDHREELDAFGALLLEREQVDRADIEELLSALNGGGRRLPARADALPTSREPVSVPVAERDPGGRRGLRAGAGRRAEAERQRRLSAAAPAGTAHPHRRRGRGRGDLHGDHPARSASGAAVSRRKGPGIA